MARERTFASLDAQYLAGAGVPAETVEVFQSTGTVPTEGPGRKQLVKRLSRIGRNQSSSRQSDGHEAVDEVLEIVSGQEKHDDMQYSRIDDPELRASIRLGDMIMLAANQMRVSIPEGLKNPDWLNFRAENVFGHFLDHKGRAVTRDLLKQARYSIRRSSLNDDRDRMLEQVAGLMTNLRTTFTKLDLPPLPTRVASSS